jgi:hypothetical protein
MHSAVDISSHASKMDSLHWLLAAASTLVGFAMSSRNASALSSSLYDTIYIIVVIYQSRRIGIFGILLYISSRSSYQSPVYIISISTHPYRNMLLGYFRTRTRTNTNPNGTEASASGRSVRACIARESKREES